ncbi:MAG: glycosyl transferase group 1 [Bacteroidetes bacterium]|nr:MAG: glycosyl transferase group 1 [Bacteroidota bacterium]
MAQLQVLFPIFIASDDFLKRAYISVINDLASDQRVHRVALLLQQEGFEVHCIGRRLPGSPDVKIAPGIKLRRYRMLFRRGPLFYACFNLRLFCSLMSCRKPFLFVANDLDTLLATSLAAGIRGTALVYDSHELFTRVPELLERPLQRNIWSRLEACLLPRVKTAITVSSSIATLYRKRYGVPFAVVRNLPLQRVPKPDRSIREGYAARYLLIYQGALNVGRGIELMIDMMPFLDDAMLLLAGVGDIEKALRKRVTEKGLSGRVVFLGRLEPEELHRYTSSADLGFSLEEDRGLSYRYALPNKLFDYIQAGIPVLCSALPEMKAVVEGYKVGRTTTERSPLALAGMVSEMLTMADEGRWKEALEKAARELCWERESHYYLALLREAGLLKREK